MKSSLPGLLGEIADIAGVDVAMEVARSHGGTRVSIPPEAEPDHWLVKLVGFDVADRICRGLAIIDADGRPGAIRREVLPIGPNSVMKRARRIAAEALENGDSGREAARQSGLHERTIWRMKAKNKNQGELF